MKISITLSLAFASMLSLSIYAQNASPSSEQTNEKKLAYFMTCQDQDEIYAEHLRFTAEAEGFKCDCESDKEAGKNYSMLIKVLNFTAEEGPLEGDSWQNIFLPKIKAAIGEDWLLESSLEVKQNETTAYVLHFKNPAEKKIAALLHF